METKPTLTKNGRRLLMKALAAIKAHPDSFNMGTYMLHDSSVKSTGRYCGTIACLAGHIVLAAGVKPREYGTYRVRDLPVALRSTARRVATRGYIRVPTLASALVVGCDVFDRSNMQRSLFYGDETRYGQIKRTVLRWLNGKQVGA